MGLPHFAAFLDSVEDASTPPPDRLVRRYALDVMRTDAFTIRSPRTGRTLRSGPSILLVDKSVLFAFPDEPEVMLGVSDVSQGFPIGALLLPQAGFYVPLTQHPWSFGERQIGWAAQAVKDTGWRLKPSAGPPILVTGDTNFAHVAWNQLSGFADLLRGPLPSGLRVLATQQPIGPLRAILPGLPQWRIEALPDTSLQACNRPGLTFLPLAAARITAALTCNIVAYARRSLSPPAREIDAALTQAWPVLWISLRTRNRTAVNQHELLEALGRRFLEQTPGAVLIDGYSLPHDLADWPDYHQREAEDVLRADRAALGALYAALEPYGRGRIHAAVGLPVSDSIALAQRATLYFCHHGTVQHKIGWFATVPGVVHCNRAILEQNPAAWVASQSDVALPPIYLPADAVEDVEHPPSGGSEFSALLRHDNYRVRDIEAAVSLVMGLAGQASPPGAPPSIGGSVLPASYEEQVKQQIEQYRDTENMHDLPPVFHLWSGASIGPGLREVFGVSDINQFYVEAFLAAASGAARAPIFLSLGCGDGAVEIGIARTLRERGLNEFRFMCYDLSDILLNRFRAAIPAELAGHFELVAGDLNAHAFSVTFNAVMANHSLHHIVDLEGVYRTTFDSLAEGGVFVTSDMIGRNGHMRWPETRLFVDFFWPFLTARQRHNVLLRRDEHAFIDHDCSTEGFEGIRSQDVLPLILRQGFHPWKFFGFGGFIDVFVDRCFGPGFNVNDPDDAFLARRLAAMNEILLDGGLVKPTMMLAYFTKVARPERVQFRARSAESAVRDPAADPAWLAGALASLSAAAAEPDYVFRGSDAPVAPPPAATATATADSLAVAALSEALRQTQRQLADAQAIAAQQAEVIRSMERSTSWELTGPLRSVSRMLRRS